MDSFVFSWILLWVGGEHVWFTCCWILGVGRGAIQGQQLLCALYTIVRAVNYRACALFFAVPVCSPLAAIGTQTGTVHLPGPGGSHWCCSPSAGTPIPRRTPRAPPEIPFSSAKKEAHQRATQMEGWMKGCVGPSCTPVLKEIDREDYS